MKTDGDFQPRRVLVLGQDLPYLVRFRGHLVRALVAGGNDTVVATPEPEPSPSPVSAWGATYQQMQFSRAGMNPLKELGAVTRLREQIAEVKPEQIFAYGSKASALGLLAAGMAGVPRRYAMMAGLGFAFVNDGHHASRRALARMALLVLYGLNFRGCRSVIFHNSDDRDEFLRRGVVRPQQAVIVAGSGVDVRAFTASPPPTQPVRFLFVGRLLRSKGVEELLAAAALLRATVPAAEVHLVGGKDPNPDGVEPALLKAAEARGDVILHGHVEDVRPYLAQCSVFVLPSYREGLPRSVLEAMACGRTSIVTDVPGCRSLVRPGRHGFLVPAHDAQALAEAMRAYATDPQRIIREGREAREAAEREFDVRLVTAAMLKALELPGDPNVD